MVHGSKSPLTLVESETECEFLVEKLRLEPGDTLVLHFDGHLEVHQCERLREILKTHARITAPILIMDQGMRMSILHDTRRASEAENPGSEATAHPA